MRLPFASWLSAILILVGSATLQAQDYQDDFSFYRNDSPSVVMGDTLPQPWVGGLNSVHFSNIDLNGDGLDDLFAFEKHGNRVLTFIQEDGHYRHAPEYARCFPQLHDWALLKDYNHDGKPDIFTYGLAGIQVYRNITTGHEPRFEPVTDQLPAYYYNGYVNIFASPDDYPVIEDVDGDGKLDILNFWVLGRFVHQLKNHSSTPEQFDFHLERECWGHFEEAADNNVVTLNTDCSSKNDDSGLRHTGSSMLLLDLDGNGLQDLLLGDIDSPHLIALYNHGTTDEARMAVQDTLFPAGHPVALYSMPAPSLITLPHTERPVIIVSPSDPSLTKSQDLNSVWLYAYDTLLQQYALQNTAFLQEDMVDVGSGCHPVLYDWNQDGLEDLFLANYGAFDSARTVNGFLQSSFSSSIYYFQNTGDSHAPSFKLISSDFGNLRALNMQALHPTFGDFDMDGHVDMLCGQKDGTLMLISHSRLLTGEGEIIPNFEGIDVGNFSTPQYFDLDRDGRKDLLIGNQRGLVSYYRNVGTDGSIIFEHVTDTLGGIDVRNIEQNYFGHSAPCFYRDDTHGTVLFCGSEDGAIHYYSELDSNVHDNFAHEITLETADEQCDYCARPLREGKRVGVAIADLNGDHYPDMIVGNYAGGVSLFLGRSPVHHGVGTTEHDTHTWSISPNPSSGTVHIHGEHPVTHVTVYDLLGHILTQTTLPTLNLSHLSSGLYILEINKKYRMKLLIQH